MLAEEKVTLILGVVFVVADKISAEVLTIIIVVGILMTRVLADLIGIRIFKLLGITKNHSVKFVARLTILQLNTGIVLIRIIKDLLKLILLITIHKAPMINP